MSIAKKLGKSFLNLLDNYFSVKLSKIFNRNTLKFSYSSMPNLKSIVNLHNYQGCQKVKQETL